VRRSRNRPANVTPLDALIATGFVARSTSPCRLRRVGCRTNHHCRRRCKPHTNRRRDGVRAGSSQVSAAPRGGTVGFRRNPPIPRMAAPLRDGPPRSGAAPHARVANNHRVSRPSVGPCGPERLAVERMRMRLPRPPGTDAFGFAMRFSETSDALRSCRKTPRWGAFGAPVPGLAPALPSQRACVSWARAPTVARMCRPVPQPRGAR
jgi:hypothetical protein